MIPYKIYRIWKRIVPWFGITFIAGLLYWLYHIGVIKITSVQ